MITLFRSRSFAASKIEARFGKALNRSMIGSMNDFEAVGKIYLADGDDVLCGVATKLNQTPMTVIGTPEGGSYATPRMAARSLSTASLAASWKG